MYLDPGTTRLIHDTMIREELQRNGPEHHAYFREPFPVRGPGIVIREITADALYRLARVVAPAPSEPAATSIHEPRGITT